MLNNHHPASSRLLALLQATDRRVEGWLRRDGWIGGWVGGGIGGWVGLQTLITGLDMRNGYKGGV